MRRFRLPALCACTTYAVLLIGCESPVAIVPPPPAPPPAPSLSFEIAGPGRIDAAGSFHWVAFAFGGSGAYQYRWEVTGPHASTTTEQTLSLDVVDTDGDMVLTLTVISGSEIRVRSFGVRNCISGCDSRQ